METTNTESLTVCRTCLIVVNKEQPFKSLDFRLEEHDATVKDMLQACVAELDLALSENAIICNVCFALLTTTYEFKLKCLLTEQIIFDHKVKNAVAKVDLTELCHFQTEIKREEEYYMDENNDIQAITNDNENENENKYAEENIEEVVIKCEPSDFDQTDTSDFWRGIRVRASESREDTVLGNNFGILFGRQICGEESSENDKDIDTISIISISSEDESDCEVTAVRQGDIQKNADLEKENLQKDDRYVDQTKSLKCEDCGKTFRKRKHYGRHYFEHKGEFPFNCDFCPFSTAYRSQLRRHRNEHSPKHFHVCPLCQRTFTNSYFLCNHLKAHEDPNYRGTPAVMVDQPEATSVEMYKECLKCQQGFLRETDKVLHIHWHSLKRYQCNIEHQNPELLKLKIYSCAYCQYSTTVAQELRYHINFHLF